MYGTALDPARLSQCAPDATLDRVAHLPSHRLSFAPSGAPVVVEDDGHTVWGVVFSIPEDQVDALREEEFAGAGIRLETTAVDRGGERIPVVAFSDDDGGRPTETAIERMIEGARHWKLPAGWIVGLEDLLDPFEF